MTGVDIVITGWQNHRSVNSLQYVVQCEKMKAIIPAQLGSCMHKFLSSKLLSGSRQLQ